jgi:hypothetical protein
MLYSTYSVKKTPLWEAKRRSAGQEPKDSYKVYKKVTDMNKVSRRAVFLISVSAA